MSKRFPARFIVLTLVQMALISGAGHTAHAGGQIAPSPIQEETGRQDTGTPPPPPIDDSAYNDPYEGQDTSDYTPPKGKGPSSEKGSGGAVPYIGATASASYGPREWSRPARVPAYQGRDTSDEWTNVPYSQNTSADDMNRIELERLQARGVGAPAPYPAYPPEPPAYPPSYGDSQASASYNDPYENGGQYGTQGTEPVPLPGKGYRKGGRPSETHRKRSVDPDEQPPLPDYTGGDEQYADQKSEDPPLPGKKFRKKKGGPSDHLRRIQRKPAPPAPQEAPNPASASGVAGPTRLEHGWDFFGGTNGNPPLRGQDAYSFGIEDKRLTYPQKVNQVHLLERRLGQAIQNVYGPHTTVDPRTHQPVRVDLQSICSASGQGSHVVSSFFGARKVLFVNDGNAATLKDSDLNQSDVSSALCGSNLVAMGGPLGNTPACQPGLKVGNPVINPLGDGTTAITIGPKGFAVADGILFLRPDLRSMMNAVVSTLPAQGGAELARCEGPASALATGPGEGRAVPGAPSGAAGTAAGAAVQ